MSLQTPAPQLLPMTFAVHMPPVLHLLHTRQLPQWAQLPQVLEALQSVQPRQAADGPLLAVTTLTATLAEAVRPA